MSGKTKYRFERWIPDNSPVRQWWRNAPPFIRSPQEIVENATPWHSRQKVDNYGVYFLVHDKRIQYVGVSTDIDGRLLEHREIYEFDAYYTITGMPFDYREDLESFYILWLKPFQNLRIQLTTLNEHLQHARDGKYGLSNPWVISGGEDFERGYDPPSAIFKDGSKVRLLVTRWQSISENRETVADIAKLLD